MRRRSRDQCLDVGFLGYVGDDEISKTLIIRCVFSFFFDHLILDCGGRRKDQQKQIIVVVAFWAMDWYEKACPISFLSNKFKNIVFLFRYLLQ